MWSIVDLGTKLGSAIDCIRKHDGGLGVADVSPASCLGVDRLKPYAEIVTNKGYAFFLADIVRNFDWPKARVYSAWDLLEHFTSIEVSQDVIRKMLDASTVGIYLRLPSFEQDQQGEGQLRQHGLRFDWTGWLFHKAHVRLRHVRQVLDKYPAKFAVRREPRRILSDSSSKDIVTLNGKNKPLIAFEPKVVGQWDMIIRKKQPK